MRRGATIPHTTFLLEPVGLSLNERGGAFNFDGPYGEDADETDDEHPQLAYTVDEPAGWDEPFNLPEEEPCEAAWGDPAFEGPPPDEANHTRGRATVLEVGNTQALLVEAQFCLDVTRMAAKKDSFNNFRTWAFRAVSKGAGAAHTWTKKGPDTKHLTMVGYDDEGAFVADPLGMMDIRRTF
jgi:hypothetical protein